MGWTVWDSPQWQQGIFSTPIQTGPGAHPASCSMSTGYLLQGVKQQGHGINHLPSSSTKVKKKD